LDYFRPDCESPARFDTFGKPRTICNHTITSVDVKRYAKDFLGAFHTPVEAVKSAQMPGFSLVLRSGATNICAQLSFGQIAEKTRRIASGAEAPTS